MDTKHGIIDEVALIDIWNVDPFLPPTITLAEICAHGVDNGFSHLWILPGADITPNAEYFQASKAEWDLFPTWQYKNAPAGTPNLLRSVSGYRQKSLRAVGQARNQVNIIFCGEQAAWEWARLPTLTAAQALRMIDFLQTALGVPISGSPGNTGYTYMTRVEEKNKIWFEKPYINSDDVTFAGIPWEKAVTFLMWHRTPTEAELSRKYLVKIDKNAAFPRAASDTKFGVGQCRPLRGLAAMDMWNDEDFKVKTPGIWKCGVSDTVLMTSRFPPIKSGWLTTALVRQARVMGYIVQIETAWIFEKGEYLLKKTMNGLWRFRAELSDGDLRRDALKQVMTDLPGLFHNAEMGPNNAKFRPDIYAGITGANYAIMLQNMQSFARTFGLYPLISHVDCIVYASDTPLSELMPDNRTSLGGYKHVWQLEMTDEVRGILQAAGGSALKLEKLNGLARAEVAHEVS